MSEPNVLQPVDVNVDGSPARKRARFHEPDESKGPLWTLSNREVVLHEVYDHGIGRLDCDSEDVVTDEDSIFNRDDLVAVDVSCASMTPDTRGKQLTVLESTIGKESLCKLSEGAWDNLLTGKPTIKPTDKTNYFDYLSDEVVLQIFRWLSKSCLIEIALCCKRFHRLTHDESLWTRMDVSNKHLTSGVLGVILSKQVIVLRLAKSEIMYEPILPDSKAYSPDFKSRLMYLDLSMAHISTESLAVLFNKCERLKKLSLENVPVNDEVLKALSGNPDIEVINFTMCIGIQKTGLRHLLTNCRQLRELNFGWTNLNCNSIKFVCENLPPTMDRLNFSGCRRLMTDSYVASLVSSCPKLRELDLSDCTAVTRDTINQIILLDNLNFVSLSRCYLIPYKALFSLKKLINLNYLDVHGGYIEENELKEVQNVLGAGVQINQFKFSSVARPTVGMRRSSIWNMRVRD